MSDLNIEDEIKDDTKRGVGPLRFTIWRAAQAAGLHADPLPPEPQKLNRKGKWVTPRRVEFGPYQRLVVQLLGRLMDGRSDEKGCSQVDITELEIAEACDISLSTAARAVADLAKLGLIRIGKRRYSGSDFPLNRYFTTPIWCTVPTHFDKRQEVEIARAMAAMKAGTTPVTSKPTPQPAPKAKADPFTFHDDDDDLDDDEQADTEESDSDRVYNAIAHFLPDHPSMKMENSRTVMQGAIDAFLAEADWLTVWGALYEALTPKMLKYLSTVPKLGGCLKNLAAEWVRDYLEERCKNLLGTVLAEDYCLGGQSKAAT